MPLLFAYGINRFSHDAAQFYDVNQFSSYHEQPLLYAYSTSVPEVLPSICNCKNLYLGVELVCISTKSWGM